MQVVGGADGYVVQLIAFEVLVFDVGSKFFKLGKKFSLGKVTVHDADRIVHVHGNDQVIAGVFNGFEVARSDIAGSTNKSKVFHQGYLQRLKTEDVETCCGQRVAVIQAFHIGQYRAVAARECLELFG